MQPPQRLHQHPDLLYVSVGIVNALDELLLHVRLEVEEALDKIAVDEAVGLFLLAHLILEGAVAEERVVAGAVDEGGELRLQADEEIDLGGGDEGEEVDGAFDLQKMDG